MAIARTKCLEKIHQAQFITSLTYSFSKISERNLPRRILPFAIVELNFPPPVNLICQYINCFPGKRTIDCVRFNELF